jgi:hypothetical protein
MDGKFTRYRKVGSIETDVTDGVDTRRCHYSVIQVERRKDLFNEISYYESELLIGNFVDALHERDIFLTTRHEGLWCSNCWAKDPIMSINEQGGMIFRPAFRGYPIGSLNHFWPCWYCRKRVVVYEDDTHGVFLFSSIRNRTLQRTVETQFLQHGIIVAERYRSYTIRAPMEFCMEIVSKALAPPRIERLINTYGIDILESL